MFTLLHTESSKGWGGQENRVLQESLGLQKRGVKVIILGQPGSLLSQRASAEGIAVRTCRMRKSYDLYAVKHILKPIKTENVDIVSTHSGRDSFLAGIAGRLSSKRPVIVRTRHLALPITSKITYSLLPHAVVTTSEYVRQYLITERIHPDKVVAIPTGVNINEFDPDKVRGSLKQKLGISDNHPLIGVVAILRFKKGHHILLETIPKILKTIPEAFFVFAGNGPQSETISCKIKDLGLLHKVFMLGLRHDISNILKSIDLFVLPTLQESLPQSLLQAMAMEKPVIGTKVGGIGEAIENEVNGYLVEPNNPSALSDAIIKLLQDKEKSRTMAIEGRKIVQQKYTIESMCEKMFDLYSSLLKAK